MTEEYMKKTRETLGKIIKKPPLTDKLLGKPPFRFLHDIFTEVIRTTGFLNGLFNSSEMDSKNVAVKEDKIAFLQKVIDVVSIAYGEQLSARPSKIVAGHEPEKTNELLQAVGKCIHKNISSDDAVKQVLSGKKPSKVQEKPPSGPSRKKEGKENREKPDDQRKKRRDRDDEKHERERSSDRRKRSAGKDGRERSKDRDAERHREKENAEQGEGREDKERHRSREKTKDKERNKEERSRDRRERKDSRATKSKDSPSTSKRGLEKKSSTRTNQKSTSPEKKSRQSKQKTSRPDVSKTEKRRRRSQSVNRFAYFKTDISSITHGDTWFMLVKAWRLVMSCDVNRCYVTC